MKIVRALPIAIFFLVWELIVRLGFVEPYLLSPPTVVVVTLFKLLFFEDLSRHILYSLFRAISGFALAALIAIPVGIAIGWSSTVDDLCSPILELFRPLPVVALIPVAILWLGIGNASKISLIAFACFFPILLNTTSGAKNLDITLLKVARSMGLKDRDVLKKVVLPGALPNILVGLRISIAVSLIILIVMEMVGAAYGIGFFIYSAKLTFQVEEMYAGILLIGIIGFTLNEIILWVSKKLLVWYPDIKSN